MKETKATPQNKKTDQDLQFLDLFRLFNQEVKLLEAERRPSEIDVIIKGLKEFARKREKNQEVNEEARDKEHVLLERLKILIRKGARHLPGPYRDLYSEPLLRNLESVQEWSSGTIETLAGAVYDHENEDFRAQLDGFLALTSNIYRSFMEPEYLTSLDFPQPVSRLPALATFAPIPNLPPREASSSSEGAENSGNLAFLPFTLPADEVQRLCGGEVAVVSMPSVYRRHPVLSWGCIAHEVGGHDVLHAFPGLLQELRRGVRELFYKGPDPHKAKLDGEDQFLGLLWQYWTEETAADVFAVMNVGPLYGLAAVLFFSSLGQQLRRYFKQQKEGDGLPALPVSSIHDPDRKIFVVDYHPPTVLALYAILGAIEALSDLPSWKRYEYIEQIDRCIMVCLKQGNKEVLEKYADDPVIRIEKYKTDRVRVRGPLQLKPGSWVWMGPPDEFNRLPDNKYEIALEKMKEFAMRVGYHIANARLATLNNHSIQDLETWDEVDEVQMERISGLIGQNFPGVDQVLATLGDDAQMFAGAVRALATSPVCDQYRIVNDNLRNVLRISFERDSIWGNAVWHPIAGENML